MGSRRLPKGNFWEGRANLESLGLNVTHSWKGGHFLYLPLATSSDLTLLKSAGRECGKL